MALARYSEGSTDGPPTDSSILSPPDTALSKGESALLLGAFFVLAASLMSFTTL